MVHRFENPEGPEDTLDALEHFDNELGEGYTEAELEDYLNYYRYDSALLAKDELERGTFTNRLLKGSLATLNRFDPALTLLGNVELAKDMFKVVHSADNFRPSVEARKYLIPKQFKKELKRVERRIRQQERYREMEKVLETSDIPYLY